MRAGSELDVSLDRHIGREFFLFMKPKVAIIEFYYASYKEQFQLSSEYVRSICRSDSGYKKVMHIKNPCASQGLWVMTLPK